MRIWNSFISYADFYKKQIFRYDIEKKKKKKTRGEIILHPVEYLAKSRFTNVSRIANVLANAGDRYFRQPFYFSTPYQATSPIRALGISDNDADGP